MNHPTFYKFPEPFEASWPPESTSRASEGVVDKVKNLTGFNRYEFILLAAEAEVIRVPIVQSSGPHIQPGSSSRCKS